MISPKIYKLTTENFKWINKPQKFTISEHSLVIETEPETDFWQRTHYGFSKNNAPAYLTEIQENFTFTVKTSFKTSNRFDQCGVLFYLDDDNWIKVSVEHENDKFARLGSVTTNLGFSDWATTDISAQVADMWYRLNLHGQDVLIEHSSTGDDYKQMRILHIHKPLINAWIGVYACSPLKSSFRARFSDFMLTKNFKLT